MEYNQSSGPKEMHETTCSDCGGVASVPFVPSGDKPVYCRDCFQKHKPARPSGGGGNYGGGGGNRGGGNYGGGGGYNSAPKEMHDATCGDCGGVASVPFKPSGDRPVYCRNCYANHKPQRSY